MAMLLGVPNSSYIDLTDIAGYGYTFDKTFDISVLIAGKLLLIMS